MTTSYNLIDKNILLKKWERYQNC